jgi:hypothetical protein
VSSRLRSFAPSRPERSERFAYSATLRGSEEILRVLREKKHADRLIRHLERAAANVQIRVVEKARREGDGRWRLVFVKRYQKATGYWQSRLIGQTFVD